MHNIPFLECLTTGKPCLWEKYTGQIMYVRDLSTTFSSNLFTALGKYGAKLNMQTETSMCLHELSIIFV